MDKIFSGRIKMKYDTTENWNKAINFIPLRGEVIVYSDYYQIENDGETKITPAIKIGDGLAYVVDLPFVSDPESTQAIQEQLYSHINNSLIHVSDNDRTSWDDKLNADYEANLEELILYNGR